MSCWLTTHWSLIVVMLVDNSLVIFVMLVDNPLVIDDCPVA